MTESLELGHLKPVLVGTLQWVEGRSLNAGNFAVDSLLPLKVSTFFVFTFSLESLLFHAKKPNHTKPTKQAKNKHTNIQTNKSTLQYPLYSWKESKIWTRD